MAEEGASLSQLLEVIEPWGANSELLEICSGKRRPCLKGAQLAKRGRILGGTERSQDPRAHGKSGGARATPMLGKPTTVSELGNGLSPRFAINQGPAAELGDCSPSRGAPASGRPSAALLPPRGLAPEHTAGGCRAWRTQK